MEKNCEKPELTPEELEALKKRHIRSFVMRRGHISAAQKRALDESLPQYQIEYAPELLDADKAFGRHAPLVLEIGCGMGETNSSRQSSFESDLHAVDGGQRRFLRLTLSDSWIGVRVVYGTGLKTRDASASVGSNPTLSAISSRIHSVPGCFLHICASFHRTRIVFLPMGASRILLRFVNITLIMVVLSTLSRKNVV